MIPPPTKIVAQPAHFLLRLRYGEATGLSRLIKPTLTGIKAAKAAQAGAAAAASPAVATTLFAHTATGGIVGWLGLGAAAATPVIWVVAAAAAAGVASYGVSRASGTPRRTAQVPLELDTELDRLAEDLFDLIGALAVRVAAIDGAVDAAERDLLHQLFTGEWGYATGFVTTGLDRLAAASETVTVADTARKVATFLVTSADCNADAMLADLTGSLHTLSLADGRLDERETLAVDAAVRVFAEELGFRRATERTADRIGDAAERSVRAGRAWVDRWLVPTSRDAG